MRNPNLVLMSAASVVLTLSLAANGGCGGDTTTGFPGTSSDSDSGSSADNDSGGSSSSDGGSASDAGTSAQDGTTMMTGAPTWTYLVSTYLAQGKIGNCGNCHSQFSSPTKAYSYLAGKGYITAGTSPALINTSQSCLSWYGGTMPPGGPKSSTAAVTDFNAWAAAGSKND